MKLSKICQISNKHHQCTHILLNHHFINIKRTPKMFKTLKDHLQGVYLIHTSSMGKQNESPDVTFKLVCSVYCAI